MNAAPAPTPAAAPAQQADTPREARKRVVDEIEQEPVVEGINYDSDTTKFDREPEEEDFDLRVQREVLRRVLRSLEEFDRAADAAEKRIVRARGDEPEVKQGVGEERPDSPDLFKDPVAFFK